MLQGKLGSGIICLILQLTIIGWIPAFIWAITALNRMYADRRTNKIIRELKIRKDKNEYLQQTIGKNDSPRSCSNPFAFV